MSPSARPSRRLGRAAAVLGLVVASTALVALPAQAFEPLDSATTGGGTAWLDVSADGTTAYVADRSADTVSVVDLITMATVTSFATQDEPISVNLSPDGTVGVVTHWASSSVLFFSTATNTVLGTPVATAATPYDAAFTADGSKVWVTNYADNSITIIDVATRTVDTNFTDSFGYVEDIELSRDGSVFWVADTGGKVVAFDASTHAFVGEVTPGGFLLDIAISPDGDTIYAGINNSPTIQIIDISDPANPAVIDTITTSDRVVGLDLSPDGTTLYTSMYDTSGPETVGRIDLTTGIEEVVPGFDDPHGIAALPSGNGAVVVDAPGKLVLVADPVIRLNGANRYATAVKISKEGFPGGADVVYVSTGLAFPDALAAGPAAAAGNGPVLLTDPTSMPAEVRAEIVRLDPARIYVVGGADRVSNAILSDLNTIATTSRISGANRFETSRLIAATGFPSGASDVYIANGLNFPDALAAGAAGATFGNPVLLVNGGLDSVDQATLDTLTALGAINITVVGGSNQVSDGIVAQLSATRLAGADRFATAYEINHAVYGADTARRAIIATGLAFPDALAASALAGQIKAPLYLSNGSCVPAAVLADLTTIGVTQVTLVGGPDRLTQSVFDLTSC